jgi:dipeptidyl aminopeptidase/acylaminoacyl peptidase
MPVSRIAPLLALVTALLASPPLPARALQPTDWYRFKDVSDLAIAPDGGAVAYLVTSYERKSDKSVSRLWLADWAGRANRQLTRGESVSEPRFTSDGRYLSYLAARTAGGAPRLWLLDRRGGQPRQLGPVNGEITGYAWSPDGRHVVLAMHAATDPAGDERAAARAPRPIVIDSFQFKQDKEGYLTAESRSHLYLLDTRSGRLSALTADAASSDSLPVFSPDGREIAYVSRRMVESRDLGIDALCVVAAAAGSTPRRLLATWSPNNQRLAWSPDGRLIAFLQGAEPKYNAYILDQLAVVDVRSGRVRTLTAGLDRAVVSPVFSADGRAIEFAVEDDGYQYPAQVTLATGVTERLAGPMVVLALATAAGRTAVLAASDRSPIEVYALEQGRLRALSAHNRALFAELTLGTVADISFRSPDGTEIHGQLVQPPDFVAGRRYPTIVWVHGGPNGQDDHSLALEGYGPQLERQLFAAHGYLVLAINYRGSSGRGARFARSILADWGQKEVEDLLAGVDFAIARGIADPARLGVGGWSYGGLLTDYLIATTPRFTAAISGAGSGNQTAMYGADQYILEYNAEMGAPWRATAEWLQVSYPFFHADRIRTPTLFLGGDRDFNVPVAGSEQMYQALRTLGVATRLVVYPGEYHVITRPSFLVDRFRRYLDWMDEYLGGGTARARVR